ncbi:hypothetical protein [Cohnella sp. AR92]|uniref:hypothetical protein n=1 Tax=Cohnella sp. AR92 TaxID=648716 RepID=UPI000F8D0DA8|nr:hypothetical protein [Cohnella sp. AR92]RUS48400.1 hypothetical protein ELR57_03000 [Cohnella sp. AR92]
MSQLLETLWNATSDLLYRVRSYDRKLAYSEEVLRMNEQLRRIEGLKFSDDEELIALEVEKLKEMRSRLLTVMEDLLFTA